MTCRVGTSIALVLAGLVMAMAAAWGALALYYLAPGRGPGAGLFPADQGEHSLTREPRDEARESIRQEAAMPTVQGRRPGSHVLTAPSGRASGAEVDAR